MQVESNKTSILITGGSGYIATAIYNSLKDIYNVTKITKNDFDLLDGFKTNNFFKDKYFDVVIHTASTGGNRLINDHKATLQTNLKMFCNLMLNKEHYGKFISFGSGAEKYATDTAYGESKNNIAQIINKKDKHYNIRIYAVFDENELNKDLLNQIFCDTNQKYLK